MSLTYFSFVDEYLKQTSFKHNALVNAISTNPNLSNTDISLLLLEIFFGGIDAVSNQICVLYHLLIVTYYFYINRYFRPQLHWQ